MIRIHRPSFLLSAAVAVAGFAVSSAASAAAGSGVVGYVRGDGTNAVVYDCGADLCELTLGNGRWANADLTARLGAPNVGGTSFLSASVRADGTSSVVFVDGKQDVDEFALANGVWQAGSPSLLSGAPLAAGPLAGYTRSEGTSSVVYAGLLDGHVHELYLRPGAGWLVGDLTARTGVAQTTGAPFGFFRADGVNSVLLTGTDGHVYEMAQFVNSGWSGGDLTRLTGAHAAAGSPHAYIRGDNETAVVYRGTDNHIYELSLINGGTWHADDLTFRAGADPIAPSADPRGYRRSDGTSAVIFPTSDGHIHELALRPGATSWTADDLTWRTGAPLLGSGLPSPYLRADGVNAVVYLASNGDVEELSLPNGAPSWVAGDLTVAARNAGLPKAGPITFHWGEDDNYSGVNGGSHGFDVALYPNGDYTFSGQFWMDEGILPASLNTSVIVAVKASNGQVFTFTHTGSMTGTFNQNDGFSTSGSDYEIAANWAALSSGATAMQTSSLRLDLGGLWSEIQQAWGVISTVVEVVGSISA